MEKQFYKVVVKTLTTDEETGQIKKRNYPVLCHVSNTDEAGKRAAEEFQGEDFKITNISLTNIKEVLYDN